MSIPRPRRLIPGLSVLLAALALTVAPTTAAAQGPPRAPSFCRVFSPLFEWQAGQERSLPAKGRPCDAAPGRRAWLILQTNGNLAFYLEGEQLWDAGTSGPGNRLVERSYGGLDIVNSQGSVQWSTGAPGADGFVPHPSGGFGIGFQGDDDGTSNALTHWTQGEGLCGAEGGCGETLWVSGEGVT
jgi:hypothetical protein